MISISSDQTTGTVKLKEKFYIIVDFGDGRATDIYSLGLPTETFSKIKVGDKIVRNTEYLLVEHQQESK